MNVQLSYTHVKYTPTQFIELIHKRVRKEFRESAKFNPKTSVLLNDSSKEFIVLKYILKQVFAHLDFKEVKKPGKSITLIPSNLEREINARFEAFLNKKKTKIKKNQIFPLRTVLEEEIVLYAKLSKLTIPKTQEQVHPMIVAMQESYLETKFSLSKSLAVLEQKD